MNNKDDDTKLEEYLTGYLKIITNLNISVYQGRMFEECAKIFRILLANWRRNNSQLHDNELNENLEDLILPSNEDWRYRVYYQLVELQRESGAIFIKNR